jgi:hypothetical protein
MSDYFIKVKNKKTGEETTCYCADDWFAHHVYGYRIKDTSMFLTSDELNKDWEKVDD